MPNASQPTEIGASDEPDSVTSPARHRMPKPGMVGIALGFGAAISYTLANACLRDVSTKLDPILCAGCKASFTALLVLPWLIYLLAIGKKVFPPLKQSLWLLFAAVQVQLFGGIMLQVALANIGIALVVPIYLGSMVFGTAILARLFLKEAVDRKTLVSLAILVAAVMVLSLGAEKAHLQMTTEANEFSGKLSFVWGSLAAVIVGLAYSVLAVIIRGVFNSCDIPKPTPVLFVAAVGMFMLGGWSIARGGFDDLCCTSGNTLAMLVGAGAFNAIAFCCLSGAISLLPVVYVNAINVSQAALAAIVGVAIFSEEPSIYLIAGLVIMAIGFSLLSLAKLRRFRKR